MSENLSQLWAETMIELEKKISKPSYETWLKTTKLIAILDKKAVIEVPNDFTKDWIEKKCKFVLKELLSEKTEKILDIQLIISQQPFTKEINKKTITHKNKKINFPDRQVNQNNEKKQYSWLNVKYTFNTFVVGTGNRLSHAAALAVSETPSKAYNPLFIYGGVGLGKTHLLHAIAHFILNNDFTLRIVYISSEKFTNEFINAIRDNKTLQFRNKYRNIDVLLIDDIQFLAGKEQTQEEFFHTFNALHENNKQIIVSSDRPPKLIPTLEDRLRSRFEWGLITDIHPPDLETRMAILRKKANQENLNIPNDVIVYIASSITSNIRELEGALTRVIAYSSFEGKNISLEMAKEALKNILFESSEILISNKKIIEITANFFKVTLKDILGKKRTRHIAYSRQIAMYICRELTDSSLPKVAEEFGGRDHTTVLHACKKIAREKEENIDTFNMIEKIKEKIKEKCG